MLPLKERDFSYFNLAPVDEQAVLLALDIFDGLGVNLLFLPSGNVVVVADDGGPGPELLVELRPEQGVGFGQEIEDR